eukprot:8213683-Ditylum_brightwellii.AAC.1
MEKHDIQGPATTTRSNKSRQAVDGILASHGICVAVCKPPMKNIAVQDLRIDDTKGQRKYNKKVRKTIQQHIIRERMEQLTQHMTFPPTKG